MEENIIIKCVTEPVDREPQGASYKTGKVRICVGLNENLKSEKFILLIVDSILFFFYLRESILH